MTRTGSPSNAGGSQASGMIGSVIAGFDGSPQSSVAAYWAAQEADLRAVPLRLIHVQEPSALGHVFRAPDSPGRRSAQHLLVQTADELRRTFPALDISIRSVDGSPIDVLSESAADSDMIVLGSRALGPVMGFVLGSVSMAVIGATNCPVVSVRAESDASYRDLVVGVDVRQRCEALLRFAFDEAEQRGCGIRFLSAWALPPLVGYGAAYDPRVHAQLEMSAKATLDDVLMPWKKRYPDVRTTAQANVGHAATQLVDSGREAGLTVVGRRARDSSLGTHIGPVAHAVLHHARTPVVVVPLT
ncbi:universal stress protein [Streptomyces sp. rh207]|uniref:universal stress protein n=2 Tax=Streptomyces TaxID=1883 RepID=UPI0027D2FFEE|nr:universal stress protein [Streptomyces sp. rh207]